MFLKKYILNKSIIYPILGILLLLWNISEKGKKASEEFYFLTKDKLTTKGKVISSKYEKFEIETEHSRGKIDYHELDLYRIVYQYKTFDDFKIEDSTYVNKRFSKDGSIKIEYVKDKPNINKVEYDFDFNERANFFDWLFSNFIFGILGLIFTFYLYYLNIKNDEKERRELDIINNYNKKSPLSKSEREAIILKIKKNAEENQEYKNYVQERINIIKSDISSVNELNSKINVTELSGLLTTFAKDQNATCIIRGLRAVSDFEYEFQMTGMNYQLNPDIETIFLMTSEKNSFISSNFVKEVHKLGGDVSNFVSKNTLEQLNKKNS